jgi:RND superfamily putative drug exporter
LKKLAEFCYSRRWLVLVGWVFLLIGLWVVSSLVSSEYRTEFELPGSESQEALDLLEARDVSERTGIVTQIVFRADQGIDDPAVRGRMEQFFADIEATADGVEITSPYDPANTFQVGDDRQIAYAELFFADRGEEEFIDAADEIKVLWRQIDVPGLQVELGGDIFAEFSEPASEFIGIAAAIVILLIAFGSVLAMGLPIGTALFGIGCGVAVIGIFTRVLAVPEFTTQVAMLIGIGVGIDYALLVVSRYRQGLHDGLTPAQAVSLAIDTSGRAVVFAGITVVISLLGMFMMNLDFMRSVSISAVAAVLFTMAASITLLPALLGFVGDLDIPLMTRLRHARESHYTWIRILGWVVVIILSPFILIGLVVSLVLGAALPGHATEAELSATFWYRWSRVIQRHPWPALILSAGLLIVLTIPVFSMRLGFADAGNRQETDTTRRAYDLLSDAFGPGFNGPIYVLVDTREGTDDPAAVSALKAEMEATEGVAAVADPQPFEGADVTFVTVFPDSSPQDKENSELVHRLRNEAIPAVAATTGIRALTTGLPPIIVDFSDYTAERLPWFFGAVLLLSFLLLLTVFHSVVVPLKAVIVNLLSIGAAFGVTIAVFQWGIGGSLLGLGKEGPIEAWAPMFIFAIVFGLSMDYEVFLLTRVREEYDRLGDNGRAVADGLAATGRVISAAALIMVCVFGAFVLGDDRSIKLIGFSLAFAILIDATVVRLILVPAAMELMGKANWWAPSWLVRILPTIRVDTVEQPVAGGGS